MVHVVNVHEAKSTLSKLLADVETGQTVVIARAGKPVADLVPHRTAPRVAFGRGAGQLTYDPDTFDDVGPDIVSLFQGE